MADRAVNAATGAGSDIGVALLDELTDFTYALRVAGLPVTIESTMDFLRAVSALDPFDGAALFRVGRLTLCPDPRQLDCYRATFLRFFGGRLGPAAAPGPLRPSSSGRPAGLPSAPRAGGHRRFPTSAGSGPADA